MSGLFLKEVHGAIVGARETEQRRVEELFAESARSHDEQRRRQLALDWISYHRLHLARATALLVDASRIEEGLPTEIGVVRNVTALEDALAMLVEDTAEAEET